MKLDISANETVIRPPVLRDIAHPYPDGPLPGRIRCYSFEEVFAEKIRAMAQRARPRDLYDIVNLSAATTSASTRRSSGKPWPKSASPKGSPSPQQPTSPARR